MEASSTNIRLFERKRKENKVKGSTLSMIEYHTRNTWRKKLKVYLKV